MKNLVSLTFLCLCLMALSCNKADMSSCVDGIQNGNETAVDCGGSCLPCTLCYDGMLNGEETEVDCGGPECPACPTCLDGIQNGTETGVDCGGICIPCVTFEMGIKGLWRVTTLMQNGDNLISIFGLERIYYKFSESSQFESFTYSNENVNSLANGSYSIVEDNAILTLTVGSSVTKYQISLSPNQQVIELNSIAGDIYIYMTKRQDNLCEDVDCNTGQCVYGYCECLDGTSGDFCELTYGPAGGIVVYDKGMQSNGWRYIEVFPELFDPMEIGCPSLADNSGQADFGDGISNTIKIAGLCQDAVENVAKYALELELNGFTEWYIPSQAELSAIYSFQDYLLDYSSSTDAYNIHSSTFEGESLQFLRFEEDSFSIEQSSSAIQRNYFLIRYF